MVVIVEVFSGYFVPLSLLLPRHQWNNIDPQTVIDFETMQLLHSREIRMTEMQCGRKPSCLLLLSRPEKLKRFDFSVTQVTSKRNSPEWEREPHDGQAYHVFSHRVVEALHKIHVDLRRDKKLVTPCAVTTSQLRLWTSVTFIDFTMAGK